MKKEGVPRRNFLKGISAFCGAGIVGISGLELWPDTAEAFQAEEWNIRVETMTAFADTIIPGPNSDPEGSVGGVDTGALEVLQDPVYGFEPFIGLLSISLNLTGLWWYGKLFKDLNLRQRSAIVLFKDDNALIKLIYQQAENLVKLAFYGAIINDQGTDYISFPGPFFGYYDYSFNVKFADEATEDGNDGTVTIDKIGRPKVSWQTSPKSRAIYNAQIRAVRQIIEALGGTMITTHYMKTGEVITAHPLGTCRMADNVFQGVVDENCRVFNYPNLYLVDGSVVPTALGVNPVLTIAAIAERVSEYLNENLPPLLSL
jgi:hypothetical protein